MTEIFKDSKLNNGASNTFDSCSISPNITIPNDIEEYSRSHLSFNGPLKAETLSIKFLDSIDEFVSKNLLNDIDQSKPYSIWLYGNKETMKNKFSDLYLYELIPSEIGGVSLNFQLTDLNYKNKKYKIISTETNCNDDTIFIIVKQGE